MLIYKRSDHFEVIGYLDSDHVSCVDTRKCTFGYLFMMAGGAILLKSAKQSVIATCTVKAKFAELYFKS